VVENTDPLAQRSAAARVGAVGSNWKRTQQLGAVPVEAVFLSWWDGHIPEHSVAQVATYAETYTMAIETKIHSDPWGFISLSE